MTLNKIIKSINLHPEFVQFIAVKGMLVKKDVKDLLIGFNFERTGDSLYIWKYIDPLIFNRGFTSFLFSDRLKIPGSIAFSEFSIEKALPILIRESKSFPTNIEELVKILDAKSGLSFEQVIELLIMKIYLKAQADNIDSELDDRLIKHLNSVEIVYDYQKERLEKSKELISKSLIERKMYFADILAQKV